MCGILLSHGEAWRAGFPQALSTLLRRGPDAQEIRDFGPVRLGHSRLAVIDPAGGAQPMSALGGQVAIVFNGEIYNFRQLREELAGAGHAFETRSDTEVLLKGYLHWGEAVLDRLDGIFAFGIFDARSNTVFAARDRIGVKPLFYATQGGLVLASTLAPFLALPGFSRRLDFQGLRDYLAFQAPLAPRTLFEDVRALAPAHCLRYRLSDGHCALRQYWQIPRPQGGAAPAREELVEEFGALLADNVRAQLVADVPLGAFLSGGIDSSLVVHYMAQAGARPLKTFSVRFREEGFDESPHARAVAERYGTEHHVLDAPDLDGDVLVDAIAALDQPLADPAYIPTFELSRLTRGHVTVALSGDGADELFAGYPRFQETADQYPDHPGLRMLRALVAAGLVPRALARRGLAGADLLRYRRVELGDYPGTRKDLARFLLPDAARQAHAPATLERWTSLVQESGGFTADGLLRADLWTYLSENCLVKADRASMAHSLEVRVPFLGNSIVDRVLRLPSAVHFDARGGKALLRELARRHLPETVWNRPKHGFSVPLRDYFNGPWRAVGDDAFARCAHIAPFLDAGAAATLWRDAKAGRASRRLAYTLLVLLVWMDRRLRPA